MPSFRVTKMPLFSRKLVSVKKFVKTLFSGCKVNMDARIQDLLVLKEPDKSLSLIHERLVSMLSQCRKSGDNRGKGSICFTDTQSILFRVLSQCLVRGVVPSSGSSATPLTGAHHMDFFLDTR